MSSWTVPGYAEGWTVPGYTEERLVGEGASGRVVAAVSELTGQRVAIKYLSPALARDSSYMRHFRTEAETLRALDVPQVVKLYDYVEAPGQGAAIVMELVDGVSLHELITQQGPTTPESALMVLKGSLLGLAAAHAIGVVHRDYKPENVLVDGRGDSKLSDFGVATKAGKKALAAGTPLYMAPEQWSGAPSSPATDIYAATAVFFECVTAKTPFSGKLGQLRTQHETASVPVEQVDEPLQHLIARGMAKNPVDRPQSAIAFVAELEATAAGAYGPDWEERGRSHLAERVAALLPLLLLRGPSAGSSGTSSATFWFGQPKRKALTIATIAAAALIAVGAAATAVTMRSHDEALSSTSKAAAAVQATFTGQASVTPPVTAAACDSSGTPAKPGTFKYKGAITATGPGTVRYQWVYSSGAPGPVHTVRFTGAGQRTLAGEVVHPAKASAGWGELKLIDAAGQAKVSNRAGYRLLCAGAAGGLVPVASVSPSTTSLASCAAALPAITANGSITAKKAGKVTYYWAFSTGLTSAPATLTFTGPGTMAVSPLTYTPTAAPASGEAVLVVTSPAAAASAPATYSVSCTAQKLSAVALVSPTSQSLTSCTAAAPAFTFTGTVTAATARCTR
jgi:serine/threonine-protein kinase